MRSLLVVLVVVTLSVASGCAAEFSGSGAPSGTSAASCADLVRYDGHRYAGHGDLQRMPVTDGSGGTATSLPCDDGTGAAPASEMPVQRLRDIPLDRGFLSHGQLYVREGRDVPEAARAWLRTVLCEDVGAFEITGRWLGVESAQEARLDGDLRPPYRITAWVTAGRERYVDTRVVVHATSDTRPQLGPDDVRRSLWEGGHVTAQVHCDGARFVADGLSTTG
jgi:hypothetical protein